MTAVETKKVHKSPALVVTFVLHSQCDCQKSRNTAGMILKEQKFPTSSESQAALHVSDCRFYRALFWFLRFGLGPLLTLLKGLKTYTFFPKYP